MKNIPVGFDSILDEAEERISELNERAVELTNSINKERISKSEDSLKEL